MTAMFPLAVWQPGTLQPSTPMNDNALRVEVLQRGATSILSTPPSTPSDGDVHIVGATPTGAWSTFAQNDVVLWRSGTWYRFAPFTGWLKQVGSDVRRFTGAAWEVVAGGGGGSVDPGQQAWGYTIAVMDGGNFSALSGPGIGGVPANLFRNISAASLVDSLPRVGASAPAAVNAVAGFRGYTAAPFCIGPSANIGGFTVKHRVIVGDGAGVSSHRFFAGLRFFFQNPTDEDPSSLTDLVGIGYDSADTQLQIIHNDASGSATKVPLGASFPKPTTPLDKVYDIELSAVAGSGQVSYVVADVATGAKATGTISSNLPAGTTMLTPYDYISAGGTSTAVSLEACWWYFRLGKARP